MARSGSTAFEELSFCLALKMAFQTPASVTIGGSVWKLLHTLFALEHNAICSQLQVANPTWTSDQLLDTARLVNCAPIHITTTPIEDLAFTKARDPILSGKVFLRRRILLLRYQLPRRNNFQEPPQLLAQLTPTRRPTPRHGKPSTSSAIANAVCRGTTPSAASSTCPPAKSFLDLTGGNVSLAEEISAVYHGKLEDVDLQVGMLSEPLLQGFGFSDAAFRVFILMASRRLKSDRFIAGQWNVETYTREGMEWVQGNTMRDVLCRHFPELRASLRNVKNAFAPWENVGRSGEYRGKETDAPENVMREERVVNGH